MDDVVPCVPRFLEPLRLCSHPQKECVRRCTLLPTPLNLGAPGRFLNLSCRRENVHVTRSRRGLSPLSRMARSDSGPIHIPARVHVYECVVERLRTHSAFPDARARRGHVSLWAPGSGPPSQRPLRHLDPVLSHPGASWVTGAKKLRAPGIRIGPPTARRNSRLLTSAHRCSVTAALPLGVNRDMKTPCFPMKQRDAGGC